MRYISINHQPQNKLNHFGVNINSKVATSLPRNFEDFFLGRLSLLYHCKLRKVTKTCIHQPVASTLTNWLKQFSTIIKVKLKVDGTSFPDAGSLVTTAHLTREICPRYLKYRKTKTNMAAQKLLPTRCFFSLSVRDWIKTKVVLWASVVKQFSMR